MIQVLCCLWWIIGRGYWRPRLSLSHGMTLMDKGVISHVWGWRLCLRGQRTHYGDLCDKSWWSRSSYNPGSDIWNFLHCSHHSELWGLEDLCHSLERGRRATTDTPIPYHSPWTATQRDEPLSWFPVSSDRHTMHGLSTWTHTEPFVYPARDGSRSVVSPPSGAFSDSQFCTLYARR